MSFEHGKIFGAYRVVRPLGKGGMGCVYEVEHEKLGTRHALKVFSLEGDNADFLRKRFFAEGRILARLNHPRLVRVTDLDIDDESGRPYFVMDLVTGPEGAPQTLASMADAGQVTEKLLFGWYEDIRQALEVVHGAGIVHRDIKPENVLVGADGHAVLTDFGVVRVVDADLRNQLALSQTMVSGASTDLRPILGTAAYLSPEVRAGREPTPSDDFYALGVMLFRLLTGVWYESGTNVLDLLLPFNPAWKKVFGALLAANPASRCAPLAQPSSFGSPRTRWVILGAAAALAAAAIAGWMVTHPSNRWEYLDELHYVPASAK